MQPDDLLHFIEEANQKGESVVIATLMKAGLKVERVGITGSGELAHSLLDRELTDKIIQSASEILSSPDRVRASSVTNSAGIVYDLVTEVLRPKVRMLVFGAGHVGQAVSLIGAMLGYAVRVYDDREELLLRERFPDSRIDLIRCAFENVSSVLGELKGAVIVIVTRGHQYDEECLRAVIGSSASYIGMIGSKRRVLSIFKKLKVDGAGDLDLAKVHAPIGLRIGAVTPQEIAVSILSEIIQELSFCSRGNIHSSN